MRQLKKELWPHKVTVKQNWTQRDITTMEIWLGQQLGTFKGRWNIVQMADKVDFYFKDSKDATLFALRWS